MTGIRGGRFLQPDVADPACCVGTGNVDCRRQEKTRLTAGEQMLSEQRLSERNNGLGVLHRRMFERRPPTYVIASSM